MNPNQAQGDTREFDYIVVGSGAGGGPLASRLAEAGFRVLVIEAGSDQSVRDPTDTALEISLVPALHAASSENEELSWRFFVEHYTTPPTGPDPKRHTSPDPTQNGIFYPRASGLGGCTIHNAMITIAGPDSDWDDLANFLDDESWRAARMRPFFQRLERNEYSPRPRRPTNFLQRFWNNLLWLIGRDIDYTGGQHGFQGWLHTSVADISIGLDDGQLVKMLKAALNQASRKGLNRPLTFVSEFLRGSIKQSLDPNHATTQANHPEGVVLVPLSVCGDGTTIHQTRDQPFVMQGRRSGPRELMLQVRARFPERLVIWTDCLVTRVLFDGTEPPRAVGVEIRRGKALYRAHMDPATVPGQTDRVFVKDGGEIILCGGTFNTPQLLMLSGLGDKANLESVPNSDQNPCALRNRDGQVLLDQGGQPRRIHLPGVGRNLQDRYEISVISQMKKNFSVLEGATFSLPGDPAAADPQLKEWRDVGTGLYSSNGAVLGIFKRSNPDLPQPDLFIFGAPVPFRGYEVGYSNFGHIHDQFTWVILKARTRNKNGSVELRSVDPLATPIINFHYFNEPEARPGGPVDSDLLALSDDTDLLALVHGVKFVRGIAELAGSIVEHELHPDIPAKPATGDSPAIPARPVRTDQEIKDWIKREAWGHHACGTCRMGPDGDKLAVLDKDFRVRDVAGLRVVDASVFPNIPGYFIVTNIYMASEKAADVLIEAARLRPADSWTYPEGLRDDERKALNERRRLLGLDPLSVDSPVGPSAIAGDDWASDVTGIGLSGGGIRSATLNLGILQALARVNQLRRVDLLSTVSGGGYIGSFLGRCFDRLRRDPYLGAGGHPARSAPSRVERELVDPGSPTISWLRGHGNYIAPSGPGDDRYNVATFLRNFLSAQFVLGVLFLAIMGLANAIRYGVFDPATAGLGLLLIDGGQLPLGRLLQPLLGPFYSPWFVICELLLLFLVLPRIVGFWVVSQDCQERYLEPPLILLGLCATTLVVLGMWQGFVWALLVLGLALFSTFIQVELVWWRGRKRAEAVGTGGAETQRQRARNYLTYDLGLAIALAGGAFGFAAIDAVGHGFQQVVARNQAYLTAFASFFLAIAGLTPILRVAANFVAGEKQATLPSATYRAFLEQVLAGLLALVLLAVPLIFYSFASHSIYQGGLFTGLAATAMALIASLILSHHKALAFVNRSSLSQDYAARLARAYLGASNPLRHRGAGSNITEVMPGDDVASILDYRPHEAGGPLHLINVIVNQTVDFSSMRGNRDRKGENLAISALGLSIGRGWHATWSGPGLEPGSFPQLKLAGYHPGVDHPLADSGGMPSRRPEVLSLQQWMAISGAAVGPGRGQATKLGTALLFGLANLRTGYWWDCGLDRSLRDKLPDISFLRRLLFLVPRIFYTQTLLISEWLALFPGPWDRYWNISDGGFFENLGGYELIRRRVPRIILCDASADPSSQFDGFAELVRKVRIDFGAEIEPVTTAELDGLAAGGHLTADQREHLGTLDELKPSDAMGGRSARHASLFRVSYPGSRVRRSLLLYLKATITGDESPDIEQYKTSHPDFPHESTINQFFDEAQWESYRQLGEHVAAPLFSNSWFWTIPL
jgi:choline dehydrogenase-like flavoprotein